MLGSMEHATFCKGCWQHMRVPIPLRGIASGPFRLVGIRPSRMNPNCCTICELMFTRVMKARKITIDATVMFSDIRDYTVLSQTYSATAMAELLDAFYDECSTAIWERDGLLNKAMGDSIMAVFNFPIGQEDHTGQAVLAARAIQHGWNKRRAALAERFGAKSVVGIGIGIDCGTISFGEFGSANKDLTAIGNVVNTAARAQSVAAGDQILLTQAVYDRAPAYLKGSEAHEYRLKGFEAPMTLYAA
jgi:adenylate cyclase